MGLGQIQQNLPPSLQDSRVLFGILGAVILLIIIGAIVTFSSKNDNAYKISTKKELLKKLDQVQAIEICAELKRNSLKCEIEAMEQGSSVFVESKQFDNAVLQLAGNQILDKTDFSLFDKTDWAASDEDRRIKLMRAMGGEASKIIGKLDGVRSAKVTFNVPIKRLFKTDNDNPSSTIHLTMIPGAVLGDRQITSIISIIRGFDSEIAPNNISITDQHRIYSAISGENDDLMNNNSNLNNEQIQIQSRVQRYLDSLFGYDNATALVSISLDKSKIMKNNTRFLPGAISTHEFAEEALGEPSKQRAYIGEVASATIESQQKAPYQRTEEEIQEELKLLKAKDPRLLKDLSYEEQCEVIKYRDELKNDKIKFIQPTYETIVFNNKKDYRQHNFSIENYPSYEQVITQKQSAEIQSVKVAVVINQKAFPNSISLENLKRAIAAVAHPNIEYTNVEIILKELDSNSIIPKSPNDIKKKFPIGKIFLVIVILFGLLVLLLFAINYLKGIFTPNSKKIYKNPNLASSYVPRERKPINNDSDIQEKIHENKTHIQSEKITPISAEFSADDFVFDEPLTTPLPTALPTPPPTPFPTARPMQEKKRLNIKIDED